MSKPSPKPIPQIVPPPARVDDWVRDVPAEPERKPAPSAALVEQTRRCTVDLSIGKYRLLKVAAATTDRRMQEILAEAVDEWLQAQN